MDPIRSQLKTLPTADTLNSGSGFFQGNLLKLEAGASRLQGRDDLGHVVGDEAEADVAVIFLDD